MLAEDDRPFYSVFHQGCICGSNLKTRFFVLF